MSKRPQQDVVNDRPWLPKFEPDRLAGLRKPNKAEERLIDTHIAPFARDFYEQVKAQGPMKPFHWGAAVS